MTLMMQEDRPVVEQYDTLDSESLESIYQVPLCITFV